MRYFTQKIPTRNLAIKIIRAWRANEDFEQPDESCNGDLEKHIESYRSGIRYERLTPQVELDLRKVQFDTENITAESEREFGGGINGTARDYLGFHTLENGLSFLGVSAGGDWESPIFFIIYDDGKKLRGYIPREGNTWNPVNKSAFGNDDRADAKGLRLRGLRSSDQLDFDYGAMRKDILERIIYRGQQ